MNIAEHPGSIVRRVKDGLFDHPGVVVPGGLVYENRPDAGEGLYSLSDFIASAGGTLSAKLPDWEDRLIILANVRKELQSPRKYSLWGNNCQDTVSRVVEGRARSHQREAAIVAALMAIILIAAAKFGRK